MNSFQQMMSIQEQAARENAAKAKHITCRPYGGLASRIKCIVSCLADFEIHLDWNVEDNFGKFNDIQMKGGGVWCEFSDLFENDFTLPKHFEHNKFPYPTHQACKFVRDEMNYNTAINIEENGELRLGMVDLSEWEMGLDEQLKQKYFKAIKKLRPVKYVRDKIDEQLKKMPEDFTSVSLKTFTSFESENESHGQFFSIDTLYDFLDEIDSQFLLTCDSIYYVNKIKEKYKDKVITTEKRTSFGDFKTAKGAQDCLIDFYLGSYSKKLYGTYLSTFSELQWWFGMMKPDFRAMQLHRK